VYIRETTVFGAGDAVFGEIPAPKRRTTDEDRFRGQAVFSFGDYWRYPI
jgi:hypothetical protein